MKNFERLSIGLIIGGAFPFLSSLVAMVIWFYVSRNEAYAPYSLLAGFSLGILIDLFFLKRWIIRRYELSTGFLISLYLLYNIGIYGMFMGFPVINLLMGIVAGYYFGKRVKSKNIATEKWSGITKDVSLFTALVMTIICISTAFLSLREKSIGITLQSMLGLNFEVTKGMIIGTILLGGFLLIAIEYIITWQTMKQTLKADF
jgi:hypothetical protein